MARLAGFSARDVRRAAERAGWRTVRQTGSHIIMEHPDRSTTIAIPNHREVRIGTLRGIIYDMGITVAEFRKLAGR